MMVDLHIHTTATPHHSFWEPEALVRAAKASGLSAIAVTDHNTTASVAAAKAAGAAHGLAVIGGVELDSAFGGKLWHTHLYHHDPAAPEIQQLCEYVVAANRADALALKTWAEAQGHTLPWLESVEATRPANLADVAHALVKAGVWPGEAGVEDEAAGMAYLLRNHGDFYSPLQIPAIVAAARAIGGTVVLAHPGREKSVYAIPATADDIAAMAAAGIDGLEVFYPTHTPEQTALYRAAAEHHGLLISAGSDSHGPRDPLGAYDSHLIEPFLRRMLG